MRTIPVFLEGITIRVDVSLDDDCLTNVNEKFTEHLRQTKEILGSLATGAVAEQILKILPGARIDGITLTSPAGSSSGIASHGIHTNGSLNHQPVNLSDVVPDGLTEDERYLLKAGLLKGKQVYQVDPDTLFQYLDLSPWLLHDDDIPVLQRYRAFRSATYKPPTIEIVNYDDDNIPF